MKSPNLNICADLAKVVARRLDPGDGDPDQLEMNKTPVTPDLIATNQFLRRKESRPLTGLQGTRLFVLFLRNRWNDKVLAVTNKRV